MMKPKMSRLATVLAMVAILSWGYLYRESVLYHLTSFDTQKRARFVDSVAAKNYRNAAGFTQSQLLILARIRWDLWCINVRAEIGGPRVDNGFIYYIVDATDRTDTRYIYVFSKEGDLIEVAIEPLA